MRTRLFFIWAAVRWLLLMFLVAPAVEAPLVAHPREPMKSIRAWSGLASWYGSEFNGQVTASGETYDPNAATAAHLTLPLGSLVRVVNPRNGRSRVVRINDRGPFVDGREIDLSYSVARRLGIEDRGVARLRIELLEVPQRH